LEGKEEVLSSGYRTNLLILLVVLIILSGSKTL